VNDATLTVNGVVYALAPAPEGFKPEAYVDGIPCIRCGVLEFLQEPLARGTSEQFDVRTNADGTAFPEPRATTPEIRDLRLSICRGCSSWVDEACSVAGCACTGTGFAARLSSQCPRGLWTA
jgi:hypothetical protein